MKNNKRKKPLFIFDPNVDFNSLEEDEKILFHIENYKLNKISSSFKYLFEIVIKDINNLKKQDKYYIRGMDEDDIYQECSYMLLKAIDHYDRNKGHDFKNYCRMLFNGRLISLLRESMFHKNIPLNFSISLQSPIHPDNNENITTYEEIIPFSCNNFLDELCFNEYIKTLEDKLEDGLSRLELKISKLYLSKYSYNEISDILNINKKSVGNAIQRIKNKIPTIFEEEIKELNKKDKKRRKNRKRKTS